MSKTVPFLAVCLSVLSAILDPGSGFGSALDGLWYLGCAPPADAVVNSSRMNTVAACREAGKFVATPVSGPYSPHGKGNNRYTPAHGGQAVIDVWMEHVRSQPDMVIFTTWKDLGEHHYVGPYNLQHTGYHRYNAFPHLAYLELSAYLFEWYKRPPGAAAPVVAASQEKLFYFYNLQPWNNSCPVSAAAGQLHVTEIPTVCLQLSNTCQGDSLGPGRFVVSDAAYPMDDKLYATLLVNATAVLSMTSGAAAEQTFWVASAGLHSFEVPRFPGAQRIRVSRAGGRVLADVVGSELVNASTDPAVLADCNHQTFTGTAALKADDDAGAAAAAASLIATRRHLTVALIRRVAAAIPPPAPALLESCYRPSHPEQSPMKTDDESRSAIHAAGTTKQQRYLSSFAYTIDSSSPAYGQMWTADDFITVDSTSGKERVWQNLILVTGTDTHFAQLSADVLHRTGQNLPVLWSWGGWRTGTQCWVVGRVQHCSQGGWPCAGGNVQLQCMPPPLQRQSTAAAVPLANGTMSARAQFPHLPPQFPHLPPQPWGVYFGDEQDLARHPNRQTAREGFADGIAAVPRGYHLYQHAVQLGRLPLVRTRVGRFYATSPRGRVILPRWLWPWERCNWTG